MSRLFATHLLQTTSTFSVTGHYDPERELWVGDNQLLAWVTHTQPNTLDCWLGVTYKWSGSCYDVEDDWVCDPDPTDTDML